MEKRNKLTMSYDITYIIYNKKSGCIQNEILRKIGTSHASIKKYLEILMKNKLIFKILNKYYVTDKGLKFLFDVDYFKQKYNII